MVRGTLINIALLTLILLMVTHLTSAQQVSPRTVQREGPESQLDYSGELFNQNFDFELKPTAPGKFRITFDNNTSKPVVIKIYDIIGNLLINYPVADQGLFLKEFDVSEFRTRLFVVEVGNSKYNKAKSVISG